MAISEPRYTVALKEQQVITLARLVRKSIRKHERQLAKSTFIPREGHRHASEGAIVAQTHLLRTLLEAIGLKELPGYDHEGEDR